MKKLTGIASALLVVLLVSNILSASPVSINGNLKVVGLQLVNSCGKTVQLRGVSTHGINWYGGCYTDGMLDFVANTMGADVLRIAMYTAPGTGGYIDNPSGMTALVELLVSMCVARGIYAIIDWHILSDNDPNTYITQSGTFFTAMATLYKNTPNVIYEICNEPNGSAVTWAVIKNYANVIIPKIRAIAPDSVIIVGTPNWSQLGSDVVASPLSYANVLYTFHFYAGTHNTGMLTPYVGSIPIFCTEWGASNSSGNGGDNYPNAQSFLNIMGGSNTAGVKISNAAWSLADNTDTSSLLMPGSCSGPPYNLSTAGTFVKNNDLTPGKTFISCAPTAVQSPTATITGTPPTQTDTPTITQTATITVTMTPYPSQLIYDGDTAGATLADGVAVPNETHDAPVPTPLGTMTETAGGNPGNAMSLKYQNADYLEAHAWTFPSKTVGDFNYMMLDVKTAPASAGAVSSFYFQPDTTKPGYDLTAGGISKYSWHTVMIPLGSLYTAVPAALDTLRFVDAGTGANGNYTVLIDNVRMVMIPTATSTASPTATSTVTQTGTITVTPTISATFTITPTFTVTPTYVPGLTFKDHYTYPDPSRGDKITFRYLFTGVADTVRIRIFTYSDRKIAEVTDSNKYSYMGYGETVWTPNYNLGNGLYYYLIDLANSKKTVHGKIGTFVVLRH